MIERLQQIRDYDDAVLKEAEIPLPDQRGS
jgi:hypothetical protein